jgi:hypothetical protein
MIDGRAGLKPIRPIAPNWTPRWNYLISAVQVNTTTPGEGFRGWRFHVGLEVKTIAFSFARASHSNPGESRCGLVVKAINLSLI